MDEVDHANELAEMSLQHAIHMARKSGPLVPQGTGECLYCAEDLSADRRWCDRECAEAYEAEQRMRARNA